MSAYRLKGREFFESVKCFCESKSQDAVIWTIGKLLVTLANWFSGVFWKVNCLIDIWIKHLCSLGFISGSMAF